MAGYTSGGEQQMCAIGRAMMSRPKMILLDEPSMGLAPQIVEEIFEIVRKLNETEGVSFLLAEQNTRMALNYAAYGYILETGRVVMDGPAASAARERGRQGILSWHRRGQPALVPRGEELQAPQAVADVMTAGPPTRPDASGSPHFDALETREPAAREADLFARLPAAVAAALKAPAYRERLGGIDPEQITGRGALAALPVLRKSDLPSLQEAAPPFGGLVAAPLAAFGRFFASPGPIFEPEGRQPDPWRGARALYAAGFRAGDIVLNTFSYHLVPAGFIMDAAARALDCAVIPAGPGSPEQQLR